MSTLEKTIVLLQEMPEQSLESLYDFIRSIWIHQDNKTEHSENSVDTSESMDGFRVLQSFAGTLPSDFDYKKNWRKLTAIIAPDIPTANIKSEKSEQWIVQGDYNRMLFTIYAHNRTSQEVL